METAEVNSRTISPEIAAFFQGRDLPTDVWIYSGVAYYNKVEDISPQPYRTRNGPIKRASYEDRAAVALQVCPPKEGEPADASFRFVGERGLYVKVVLEEVIVNGEAPKEEFTRWTPYNEEGADFKDIRYT